MQIEPLKSELIEPDTLYWARRPGEAEMQIVMISTIFGTARDYWTVAVMGSDQHHTLDEFQFVTKAVPPAG
jgi:hypothetical protein